MRVADAVACALPRRPDLPPEYTQDAHGEGGAGFAASCGHGADGGALQQGVHRGTAADHHPRRGGPLPLHVSSLLFLLLLVLWFLLVLLLVC